MFDRALMRLAGMPGVLASLLVSAFVQAGLVIAQMLALSTALFNLWSGDDIRSQLALLATFAVCMAVHRIVAFAQDELLDRYSTKAASKLRDGILEHAFAGSAALARTLGTAATATAATDNIDDIARYIRVIPPKMCGLIGIALPLAVALFAVDWVSGLIAVIALPVIVFFMIMLGRQAQARAESQFAENQRLSNHFIDTLRGVETIHALDAGDGAAEAVFESSEDLRAATVKTLSVATLSSAVLDLITVFGIAAIAMMLAFRLLDGSMPLDTALAALLIAPEYFSAIKSFSSDFHASLDGKNALAAALAIIDSSVESTPAEEAARIEPWSDDFTLEADGIGFSYDGEAAALEQVRFAIRGISKVGIVGMSGSGKSTLIELLSGFRQPTSGSFFINGKPVDLCTEGWSEQLHYIPQAPYLFNASIADNIRFYAPDASDEDVRRAASGAGLDSLLSELPDGLDTIVGQGGRSLSGGEAQRVALARILVDNRPILLFDEPTAHLDIETEFEFKQRMLNCMRGKLVFFATHRLHWLNDMDYVIVLEDGHIVQAGTPAELMQADTPLMRLAAEGMGGEVA